MKKQREPTEAECALFLSRMGFAIVDRQGKRVSKRTIEQRVAREDKRRKQKR